MDLKAIVLDIDGTLLNDQKEISPRTRDSLLKAQEAGIKVVLASGRPISALERFFSLRNSNWISTTAYCCPTRGPA